MDEVVVEETSIPVAGGALALTKFRPAGAPKAEADGCVLINCAMSVTQSFYAPFARLLAGLGHVAFTWDYRGIGRSALDPGASRSTSLVTWGRDDLSLVIAAVGRAEPERRLVVVGHSFGGQIVALPDNRERVRAVLLVACPSGYVGHWRGAARGKFMWGLAHLGIPVLTRISGKFPASKLGLGSDLPRQAALDWGAWLRHPLYIASEQELEQRMASFAAPIHSITSSDDAFAPLPAVEAMVALYRGASVTLEVVSPQDFGIREIGHMGLFRQRSAAVRQTMVDRIEALLARIGAEAVDLAKREA